MSYRNFHNVYRILAKLKKHVHLTDGLERRIILGNIRRLEQHLMSNSGYDCFMKKIHAGVQPEPKVVRPTVWELAAQLKDLLKAV